MCFVQLQMMKREKHSTPKKDTIKENMYLIKHLNV